MIRQAKVKEKLAGLHKIYMPTAWELLGYKV